jgi:hypothetical protein
MSSCSSMLSSQEQGGYCRRKLASDGWSRLASGVCSGPDCARRKQLERSSGCHWNSPSQHGHQALTSKLAYANISLHHLPAPSSHHPYSKRKALTSSKKVVTTVRSANFRPASAANAFFAPSFVSYFKKILPTPADCRLPIDGRGIFMDRIVPYLAHSSRTSSQISEKFC